MNYKYKIKKVYAKILKIKRRRRRRRRRRRCEKVANICYVKCFKNILSSNPK
jgi:hypothetical protein